MTCFQIQQTVTNAMHADSMLCITMGPGQRTTFGMHESESAAAATASRAQITRSRATSTAREGLQAAAQIGGYSRLSADQSSSRRVI